MKANRIHAFGSPAVITFEDVPIPEPGPSEVLVRIMASGVGPWDGWIRSGKSVVAQPLPLTLGSDFSGVVLEAGPGVDECEIGDEVFGVTNAQFTGSNAEYAVAKASMIVTKPRRLGHIDAASVPVIAVTAWQMLFVHAHLAPGQTVLILGAAGNVGAYAVQLARLVRAHVNAVASERDARFLHALDVDEIFSPTFSPRDLDPVDVVIDLVGGEMQRRGLAALKQGGILVSAVSQPSVSDAERLGVGASFMLVDVSAACLTKLAAMFDARELETNIGAVLSLAEARTAHEMLEGVRSRARGKIVLRNDASPLR